MEFEFEGKVWFWKGPAPWYFVSVPPELSERIKLMANSVTYGWGMIPVYATVGRTRWYTAMFEKDGLYILPLKVAIRKAERIEEDEMIVVRLEIGQ